VQRDWRHLNAYLDRLAKEVLPEPPTAPHSRITLQSFQRYVLPQKARFHLAVDIGCGPGQALVLFRDHGIRAIGVTLSEHDVQACRERGLDVVHGDQSFLDFPERHFDLVWSRHCLEHSPMPLLTLFEYNRVLRDDFAVRGYNLYTLSRSFPNNFLPSGRLEFDDYYYAYWLQKTKHVFEAPV
jgi:SAM-dependent methyltransferase